MSGAAALRSSGCTLPKKAKTSVLLCAPTSTINSFVKTVIGAATSRNLVLIRLPETSLCAAYPVSSDEDTVKGLSETGSASPGSLFAGALVACADIKIGKSPVVVNRIQRRTEADAMV